MNENIAKQSDFSIDHILNRAGENCKTIEECDKCPKTFNYNTDTVIEPQQLDWLNYTRYKPPKIPRPHRSIPVKRTPGRLPRIPFTTNQLKKLEEAYKNSTYLSSNEANILAKELNLNSNRVKIWFQNRRARERREQKFQSTNYALNQLTTKFICSYKMYTSENLSELEEISN